MPKRTFTPEQKRRRKLAVQRWQAKQKAAGRCVTCGSPRKKGNRWHCARHATANTPLRAQWREENLEKEWTRTREAATKRRRKAGVPIGRGSWNRENYSHELGTPEGRRREIQEAYGAAAP